MLKDTGIPPMQFREKTCVRGHRSFGRKITEINTPPRNDLGKFNNKIKDVF